MTTIETSFFGDRISIICVSEWGYYVTQLLPSTLPLSPNNVIEALGPLRAAMFSLYPIIFTLHIYWWPPACEMG